MLSFYLAFILNRKHFCQLRGGDIVDFFYVLANMANRRGSMFFYALTKMACSRTDIICIARITRLEDVNNTLMVHQSKLFFLELELVAHFRVCVHWLIVCSDSCQDLSAVLEMGQRDFSCLKGQTIRSLRESI